MYCAHNPVGVKSLTRLRFGLSHLRSHKFDDHFRDTTHPWCSCGINKIESIEHSCIGQTILLQD